MSDQIAEDEENFEFKDITKKSMENQCFKVNTQTKASAFRSQQALKPKQKTLKKISMKSHSSFTVPTAFPQLA
jgi:hypothetical protein